VVLELVVMWLGSVSPAALPCHPKTAAITPADEQIQRLFDERFYRLRYPDVEQLVRRCVYRSGLDHFLLEGMQQRRDPNLWFNEEFYLRTYPAVAQAVANGAYRSGFDQYIKEGMKQQRDPSRWFNERYYLERYPDVARAVRDGVYRSGSDHFARRGLAEGRNPTFWFDETLYRRKYPDVARAVAAHRVRSGLEHYVLYGRASGRLPEALSTAAVQRAYQTGVPHTDRQGAIRFRYDSESFFPRCLYHAMAGTFQAIKAAGFNCIHPWEGYHVGDIIGELRLADLQLIKHWPTDGEVSAFAADPHILAWYLDEEPTAQTYLDAQRSGDSTLMGRRYREYLSRRAEIKRLDARHPVFSLGTAWIPPGYEDWWERWDTAGDVTAHDNYCLLSTTTDFESLTTSVPLAVAINREQKPMWLTLQAFSGTADRKSELVMPTAGELRGMAFTGIIHGATGLIFFALDSKMSREGLVLGIAPQTPTAYDDHAETTPAEASRSRALWIGAASLNAELNRLTPELLSPTAGMTYRVYYSGESHTQSPIRTMLKLAGGRYTLFVANIEKQAFGTRFEFPSAVASVRRLNPNGSTTELHAEGAMFSDTLTQFGVAVYQLRFKPGSAT
jgi:hypothetical protein